MAANRSAVSEQKRTAELFSQLAADPKRLKLCADVFSNPRRALESLDLLIRSSRTSAESRARYREIRDSLESYLAEVNGE